MSRITISDLAIDSNSFLNEVDETEAAFVNGGRDVSKGDALVYALEILAAFKPLLKISVYAIKKLLKYALR